MRSSVTMSGPKYLALRALYSSLSFWAVRGTPWALSSPRRSSNSANMVWRYSVPLNCSRKWLMSQARSRLSRVLPSRCSMSKASLQVEATSATKIT